MRGEYLDEERRRERLVRTLPCPWCGAEPGGRCTYPAWATSTGVGSMYSHTCRYETAVAAGLVPPRWVRYGRA